jgi:phosphotransferase system HPr-like phosphotransfer protein
MIIRYDAKVDGVDGFTILSATDFVMNLSKYVGDFTLRTKDYVVDAKSILGLISLVLQENDEVVIFAKIRDDDEQNIETLVKKHFHLNSKKVLGDVVINN